MNKNTVDGATCKELLQVQRDGIPDEKPTSEDFSVVQKKGAREAEVVAICGHLARLKFFPNNPKEEK